MPKKHMYTSVASRGVDVSGKGAKGQKVNVDKITMSLDYGGKALGNKKKMKGKKSY